MERPAAEVADATARLGASRLVPTSRTVGGPRLRGVGAAGDFRGGRCCERPTGRRTPQRRVTASDRPPMLRSTAPNSRGPSRTAPRLGPLTVGASMQSSTEAEDLIDVSVPTRRPPAGRARCRRACSCRPGPTAPAEASTDARLFSTLVDRATTTWSSRKQASSPSSAAPVVLATFAAGRSPPIVRPTQQPAPVPARLPVRQDSRQHSGASKLDRHRSGRQAIASMLFKTIRAAPHSLAQLRIARQRLPLVSLGNG